MFWLVNRPPIAEIVTYKAFDIDRHWARPRYVWLLKAWASIDEAARVLRWEAPTGNYHLVRDDCQAVSMMVHVGASEKGG